MPTGYLEPEPPCISPKAAVVPKTASATLTVADFGKTITNTGAGAGITLTLPDPSVCAGCVVRVQITAAFAVILDPLTKQIYVGGDGVAAKTATVAGVIGNYALVYSDGVAFLVHDYNGAVTKAP